jgi:hypothetical protein
MESIQSRQRKTPGWSQVHEHPKIMEEEIMR